MLVTGYAMMNKIGFMPPPIGDSKQESQGEIPFTLSRLDWLELKLNATMGCYPVVDNNSGIFFSANASKDTITICVYHKKNATQDYIQNLINYGDTFLSAHLKILGWDWVNIEVQVLPNAITE